MKTQDMNSKKPGWRPSQAEVVDWLNKQPLCVLTSLAIDGRPQAATVAFSETDKLELIIGTSESSRKASNMTTDGRVAVTITDPEARYTVQAEGLARRLTDQEFDSYADRHYAKLPASAPFRHVKGQCFFLIETTWLRFSDCNPYPWITTEFTPQADK